MDQEAGAEIYSAAADKEQASLVFDCAKAMIAANKQLQNALETYRRSIVYMEEASSYKPLSADAFTKHGFNAHAIIFDELHAQPNRELVDVLHTSTGSRRQPLEIYITTAGFDRNTICWEYHDYALKCLEYRQWQEDVRNGKADADKHRGNGDPTFLPVIFAATEEDDWHSPEVWKKANPNLGISIKEDYLIKEHLKACELPAYENTFKRLHLCIWTSQQTRWIPMDAWDKCGGLVDPEDLKGKPCWLGMDLSTTQDISAVALLFPLGEIIKCLMYFWVPEENLVQRVKKDHVPYDVWARQKFIETTPGNVIDYDFIRKKINDLKKVYNIREIGCDKWNAVQIMTQLEADGFTVASLSQGYSSMSAPTKALEGLVLSRRFEHGNNPVLRWMADNVAIRQDSEGNIRPDKEKSTERIDGVVAIINGMSRLLLDTNKTSIYTSRGILTL
jgi:phage terminase large subunit-like protein